MGLLDFEGATPEENTLMQLSLLSSAFQSLSDLGAGRPQQNPMQGILGMYQHMQKRNEDRKRAGLLSDAYKNSMVETELPGQQVSGFDFGGNFTQYEPVAQFMAQQGNDIAALEAMPPSPSPGGVETVGLDPFTPNATYNPATKTLPGQKVRNFDINRFSQNLIESGDVQLAGQGIGAMLKRNGPDDMFGKIMPHAYTPESLSKFQRSGNYSDLVPYGGGSNFGKVNPGQFTPESIARFAESGNYGDLVPFRSPVQVDTGGQKILLDPGTQRMRAFDVTPRPGEMPSLQAAQETAKGEARLGVERQAEAPKALARAESADAKFKNLESAINRAKGLANAFSTGLGAQVLSGVGGTQAYDLAATLDTVKANLGFDELQEMRNNSPTGGALGQVAVQEIQYLQSVLASVQQAQSKEQLVKNLDLILEAKRQSNERIRRAYEQTYQQAPKDNGKSGTLTPEQILNSELQDALARGDTQNVNAILREMKARGFKEATKQQPKPQKAQSFDLPPNAKPYEGKILRDTKSGKRFKSVGGKWQEVK